MSQGGIDTKCSSNTHTTSKQSVNCTFVPSAEPCAESHLLDTELSSAERTVQTSVSSTFPVSPQAAQSDDKMTVCKHLEYVYIYFSFALATK